MHRIKCYWQKVPKKREKEIFQWNLDKKHGLLVSIQFLNLMNVTCIYAFVLFIKLICTQTRFPNDAYSMYLVHCVRISKTQVNENIYGNTLAKGKFGCVCIYNEHFTSAVNCFLFALLKTITKELTKPNITK